MTDLIRWKPFHGMMRNFFNDLSPFFGSHHSLLHGDLDFSPLMDIKDGEKEIEITVDLPGIDKKDIDVSVNNGVLTLKGERKSEKRDEKEGIVHCERSFGKFERRITLPDNIDDDNLKAEFKDGVLTLTAPKKEVEEPESKKIAIS